VRIVFVFVFVCSLSQSLKVKWQQTLAKFCTLASDCTENRGLLVAQALLQVTAKLAQQANCLTKADTRKDSWPVFTLSTDLFSLAFL